MEKQLETIMEMLAKMDSKMDKGFAEVNARIDDTNKRMDARFDSIDDELRYVEHKLHDLDKELYIRTKPKQWQKGAVTRKADREYFYELVDKIPEAKLPELRMILLEMAIPEVEPTEEEREAINQVRKEMEK